MENDGRKFDRKTLADLRIFAVKQVESGASPEEVIEQPGLHRSCIYRWLSQYREGGYEALMKKSAKGNAPKINDTQLQKLYKIITNKNPLQLNFEFALWTRSMIRDLIREKFNADRFIVFLKRLIYRQEKPIFLILDGHPVHKSGKVKEFVGSTQGMLRLFILPPYSPHLNPDEWVWNWLKNHKPGRSSVTGPDQFRAIVKTYLNKLSKLKKVIKGFFGDPDLSYIGL